MDLDTTHPAISDLRRAARELFCYLISSGRTAEDARGVLIAVQPFDRVAALVNALDEEDCS